MLAEINTSQRLILLASLLASACSAAPAAESPESSAPPAEAVFFRAKGSTLDKLLKEIGKASGIGFKLAAGLGQEKISANLAGKTWPEAVQSLLKPYNYVVETQPDGSWLAVSISGKKGDGTDAPPAKAKSASARQARPKAGPALLRKLPPAAVTPITLPLTTLKGMKIGQKISLDLATGPVKLVHDNRFNHANGDITWVGYVDESGETFRALITWGSSGPMGNLITPDGHYQIVSEDGDSYLVDPQLAGLKPGSILEDQASPTGQHDAYGASSQGVGIQSMSSSLAGGVPVAAKQPSSGQATPATPSTIDLLVVYSQGLAQAQTRINHLAALTNQAFLDSKINAQIRVVHLQTVDYTETNANGQALSDLSAAKPPFDKIPALREKYGADLVAYLRPLHADTQGGCGIAWVNGIAGGNLSPDWAYSVVSDGYDRDGGLVYCGEQTLAHELGHNLGNVHDRAFSNAPGAFPYSYAWGVEGSFGTIMSYRQPGLFLFASPLLGKACAGQACGYPEGDPNASDNSKTINQTAPIVMGFKPTATPVK